MTKKERERADFENFIHLSGHSFDHFLSADEPEPDVVAFKKGKVFGVEITNFYRQETKQRESDLDRITKRASELFVADSDTCLNVTCLWAPHYRVSKREHLAQHLASLVKKNVPEPGQTVHLDWQDFSRALMEAVSDIWIDRPINSQRHFWHSAGGGLVSEWDRATLQKVVDENNSKPARYTVAYTETWLVIISPFSSPSAWMEMNEDVERYQFQTSFNRVFLLSSFPFRVFQLQTMPQGQKTQS